MIVESYGRPLIATCQTQWYRDAAVPCAALFEIEHGGPTMAHGIHQMDLLLTTFGDWEEVTAVASRNSRDTGTEDVSMALVRFSSGVRASIVNSVVSPRQVTASRFDFENATVELDRLHGYTDDDFTVTAGWATRPGGKEAATSPS